jgi:putative intracellular protease/amidase
MSGTIDILNPQKPKRLAIVASNPSLSKQTGWPMGFWWSELTHPYWEFVEHGSKVDIYSPDGGKLQADNWSDPRDENKYSASDLLSLGFLCSPEHAKLVEESTPISQLKIADYGAVLFVGGQAPMYTYYNDERVHTLAAQCYKEGRITAVLCHATCILLKTKVDASFWSMERRGPASPIPKSDSPMSLLASAFSHSGLRTRRRSFRERISLCPAVSKPTRFVTAISSRGSNSIQALSWLGW